MVAYYFAGQRFEDAESFHYTTKKRVLVDYHQPVVEVRQSSKVSFDLGFVARVVLFYWVFVSVCVSATQNVMRFASAFHCQTVLLSGFVVVFFGRCLGKLYNIGRKVSNVSGRIVLSVNNYYKEYENVRSRVRDALDYSTWHVSSEQFDYLLSTIQGDGVAVVSLGISLFTDDIRSTFCLMLSVMGFRSVYEIVDFDSGRVYHGPLVINILSFVPSLFCSDVDCLRLFDIRSGFPVEYSMYDSIFLVSEYVFGLRATQVIFPVVDHKFLYLDRYLSLTALSREFRDRPIHYYTDVGQPVSVRIFEEVENFVMTIESVPIDMFWLPYCGDYVYSVSGFTDLRLEDFAIRCNEFLKCINEFDPGQEEFFV